MMLLHLFQSIVSNQEKYWFGSVLVFHLQPVLLPIPGTKYQAEEWLSKRTDRSEAQTGM
jgi:hypothetical protein